MPSSLALNLDFVLILLSGLLLLLTTVSWSLAQSEPERPWLWLAWFAGFNFLHSGLELEILVYGSNPVSPVLHWSLLTGAHCCLIEFARCGIPRRPGRWIFLPLLGSQALVAALAGPGGIEWGGFALAMFAGGWTAVALRNWKPTSGQTGPGRLLPQAGALILLQQFCLAYPGPLLDPAWLDLGPEPPRFLLSLVLVSCLTGLLLAHYLTGEKNRCSPGQFKGCQRRRLICSLAILLLGLAGWITADHAGRSRDQDMRQQVLARTQIAAAGVPADAIGQLHWDARDLQNPAYLKLKALLTAMRLANQDLRFVLLVGLRDQRAYFLADSENPASPDYSPPGQSYDEATPEYLAGLASGRAFVLGPETDRWGIYISGLAPIFDSRGKRIAYLDLDIAAADWNNLIRRGRLPSLLIALLIATLVAGSFRALERLRENAARISLSEQRNRSLVEGSPDCVQMFDLAGRYLAVNQNGLRALGRPATEVLGRHFSELWPEASRARIIEAVHTTVTGQSASFEAEYVTPEGRTVTWRVATNPIYDEAGRVGSFVAICVDFTARKQAELAMLAAKKAAEDATRAKSDFLAVMSHEIRTPLAGVIGMLDLLQQEPLSTQPRRYTRFARDNAESLLHLLDDALDWAKIEAGKLTLETIAFRPHEYFESVFESASVRASAKGLRFHRTVSPTVPAVLLGDPSRLRQILDNLVNNALKFTEHGHIRVALEAAPAASGSVQFKIIVNDTGIGISPENLGRLFARYSQADASTTRRFGGTGLGLSIVKSLAELMSGEISVTSTPGAGSTFVFSGCLAVSQTTATAPAIPAPAAVRSGARLRVLVVDDDETNRAVATGLVTRLGHHVEQVTNGREAVDRLIKESFDVVLMDSRMPVMDGLTATGLIRDPATGATDPAIHIIALTANASADDRASCFAARMDDFVTKPVRAHILSAALDRAARALRDRRAPPEAPAPADLPPHPPGLTAEQLFASLANDEKNAAASEPGLPAGLLEKITVIFLQDAPVRLASMREAFRQKDADTLGREAHTLKSNARYLQDVRLAELAAQAETLAKQGKLETLAPLLEQIEQAHAALRERLLQRPAA